MGSCCSSKIQVIQRRYDNAEIKKYFISKIQLQYLQSRRIKVEKQLHEQVLGIEKDHMQDITNIENEVQAQFHMQLEGLNTQPQLVQESENRHNMKMEEIIGLQASKKKFQQLKNIVKQNIAKVEQQMMADVKRKLDTLQATLNKKVQPNIFGIKLSKLQIQQLIQGFRHRKKQQTEKAQKQIEEDVRKKINFDRYSKRFMGVVPREELLALSQAAKTQQQDRFIEKLQSDPKMMPKGWCWCLPDIF